MKLIDANGREIETGTTLKALFGTARRRVVATDGGGAWCASLSSKTATYHDAETLALFWTVCDEVGA